MKNNIFALALIGLIAVSCGTSGHYASSRFDDAIYSGPDKTIVIASATDNRLQELKQRTAQTSTITVNGKEAQIVYIDENNTVDIPVNLDEDNTYLVIDESISYEELLRKFDSPDYTINLHIEDRWNDWDYYRPWMYDYRPWSWRYYSRYYLPWGTYPFYNPYFRDPFFHSYSYFYGNYYDPWGPFWFNSYRPYYGSYYNHYNYGGYYGYGSNYYDRPYIYGEPNRNSRGKVIGKKPSEHNYSNRGDSRADNRDRGVITSIPRQGTTAGKPATRENTQSTTTPVSNSVYRRGNTSNQGISYGENTVNQSQRNTIRNTERNTERSTEGNTTVNRRSTYNSGSSQSGERQSTGNYRRSTITTSGQSEAARNSGNNYNSTQVRRSTNTSQSSTGRSSSYNSSSSRSTSSYSRSSETSSSSRSSSNSSSSSSSSSNSSSSSSSGSAYRR